MESILGAGGARGRRRTGLFPRRVHQGESPLRRGSPEGAKGVLLARRNKARALGVCRRPEFAGVAGICGQENPAPPRSATLARSAGPLGAEAAPPRGEAGTQSPSTGSVLSGGDLPTREGVPCQRHRRGSEG